LACPCGAIYMEDALNGHWYKSNTRMGPLFHARLGIAEENSGKLVSVIKKEARSYAAELNYELIIVDGPPGTSCPVISSISGATFVVIVTEPTISGMHDLERVMKLANHFKVPVGVMINKSDLNSDYADEIRKTVHLNGSVVLAELPYDRTFTEAQLVGMSIVEFRECSSVEILREAWKKIMAT